MRPLALAPVFLLAACATTPAVSAGVHVDPDTRPSCTRLCEGMGLRLAAVVLVRNSAGCVCMVPEAGSAAAPRAAVESGGIAAASGAILALEDEAQQAQQAEPPPPPPPALTQ